MQDQDTPYGYCQCGCGERTKLAGQTDNGRGITKGEPRPFLRGHRKRDVASEYQVDPSTGCWVWSGCTAMSGYGQLQIRGRRQAAHRWYYEMAKGAIPVDREIDHLCRNRACVNPEHLEAVTDAENTRRGVNTKLTLLDVEAIRGSDERGVDLAARYGVTPACITAVRKRKNWKDV